MTIGAGKYDDEATRVRESAQALGVLVLVAGGEKGSGFSVQGPLEFVHSLPEVLEIMAEQIRADREMHRLGL